MHHLIQLLHKLNFCAVQIYSVSPQCESERVKVWKCESVKVKAMHRLMQLLNRLNFSAFKSTPKLTPNALRLQKEDIEGTVLLVTSASRDVFMRSICWNDKNCWVTHKIVQWCIKWRIDFYIPLLFTLIGLWKQEIRNESSGPESVVAIFVWSVGEQ